MAINKSSLLIFLLGLAMLGGGAYLVYYFWEPFLEFLKGGVGILLLFLGGLFALLGGTDLKE